MRDAGDLRQSQQEALELAAESKEPVEQGVEVLEVPLHERHHHVHLRCAHQSLVHPSHGRPEGARILHDVRIDPLADPAYEQEEALDAQIPKARHGPCGREPNSVALDRQVPKLLGAKRGNYIEQRGVLQRAPREHEPPAGLRVNVLHLAQDGVHREAFDRLAPVRPGESMLEAAPLVQDHARFIHTASIRS